MSELALVRLSRDRRWAVCANVDCGERFAERLKVGQPVRVIPEFLPGWIKPRPTPDGWSDEGHPGGVWMMSKRVRQRVSAGERPSYRRHRCQRRQGTAAVHFRLPASMTHTYPSIVICPACGLRQEVSEEALELR